MPNLTGPHLIIILFIILLLFGAPKLPALARSIGQSMKIFKKEVRGDDEKNSTTSTDTTPGAGDDTPTASK